MASGQCFYHINRKETKTKGHQGDRRPAQTAYIVWSGGITQAKGNWMPGKHKTSDGTLPELSLKLESNLESIKGDSVNNL